jgi:hypothetical protein
LSDASSIHISVHHKFMRKTTNAVQILLILLCALSGCSRQDKISARETDIQALIKLDDASSWSYKKSRFNIQVYEKNTVEIDFQGDAVPKNTNTKNPLMIPLVLTKEAPQYIKAIDDKNQEIELQTYKIKNGLWGSVAVIPTNYLTPASETEVPETLKGTPIRVKVLLVSSLFEENLPILIPAGQSRDFVDAAITLPESYKFNAYPSLYTVLPLPFTDGVPRADIRLSASDAGVWDISNIKYGHYYVVVK